MILIPSLPLRPPADVSMIRERLAQWEWLGFRRLRLELDVETPDPQWSVGEVLRDLGVLLQVGSAVATSAAIEGFLDAGAAAVVVGERAVDDPDWLRRQVGRFPEQLIVRVPAHERPRQRPTRLRHVDFEELYLELNTPGLQAFEIVFEPGVEISHADLGRLEDLAGDSPTPLTVAGGVLSLDGLRNLEFRGIASAVLPAERVSAIFDEQLLARSFSD